MLILMLASYTFDALLQGQSIQSVEIEKRNKFTISFLTRKLWNRKITFIKDTILSSSNQQTHFIALFLFMLYIPKKVLPRNFFWRVRLGVRSYFSKTFFLNKTVSIILIDLPFKEAHPRFTTIPFNI